MLVPRHLTGAGLHAPQADVEQLKERMGWKILQFTTTDDFYQDFDVPEYFGFNLFLHDGEEVFRTHFTNGRAAETIGLVWSFLDLTPLGRQQTWEDSPEGYPQDPPYSWWRLHDEYDDATITPDRVRRARQDGTIPFVWEPLSEPWRACVGLAWEAYRAGSLPIGAVVADTEGRLLSSGRNRIHECTGPPGTVFGRKLAHAELNALLSLEGEEDPRACVLYTTTEPCPLCVGAARMADVGGLRYASRELWAGSADMFETVPYLRRANLGLVRPENPRLEAVLVVLLVERYLRLEPKVLPSFLNLYEEVMPSATRAARNVHSSGLLRTMGADGASAREMVLALSRVILLPDAPVFSRSIFPKRL